MKQTMKTDRADSRQRTTGWKEPLKSSFCVMAVATAALVLTGCASGPQIHQGLVTTTPVTQNRDHATYDWPTRHAAVLEFNRTHQPEIVLIGDSILHYWGGEPAAPKAWAADVWKRTFAGWSVENLGFGWDRTENVLWRIDHGELNGISPKLIIIKIGTNNTGINSADDIADGIEAVCARAHEIQPRAKILLLGILPRRDEGSARPAITDQVNQTLLARLGRISWIHYRDFGPAFRNPDGSVNAALFADHVHPNHAGYELLGKLIHEQMVQILKLHS
jgi:lysophospholipase L1-like esterase